MDTNGNTATSNSLIDKGIIFQSGAICQDKINLISGAMTAQFIETIWTFLDHDKGAIERVLAIFSHLYQEGHEVKMMAVLHILYDISGLKFPEDVELLAGNPKARQCFLFSFLLDMEDCIQGLVTELTG